jgi:hypothetical protein
MPEYCSKDWGEPGKITRKNLGKSSGNSTPYAQDAREVAVGSLLPCMAVILTIGLESFRQRTPLHLTTITPINLCWHPVRKQTSKSLVII